MTLNLGQLILNAYSAIRTRGCAGQRVFPLHVDMPMLSLTASQEDAMLDRIRQGKLPLLHARMSWNEIRAQTLPIELSEQEIDDVVSVVGVAIRENRFNHGDVSALVGPLSDLYCLFAELRAARVSEPLAMAQAVDAPEIADWRQHANPNDVANVRNRLDEWATILDAFCFVASLRHVSSGVRLSDWLKDKTSEAHSRIQQSVNAFVDYRRVKPRDFSKTQDRLLSLELSKQDIIVCIAVLQLVIHEAEVYRHGVESAIGREQMIFELLTRLRAVSAGWPA